MGWRRRVALSPWWVQAAVSGVPFAGFMIVARGLQHHHWIQAVVTGALSGVGFGVLMGRLNARRNRELLEDIEDVPSRAIRDAVRDSRRGRPPADPDLWAAALTLAYRYEYELAKTRFLGAVVFSVGTLGYSVLAATSSRWWALVAAFFAAMLILWWWAPRRLRRQIAMLEEHSPNRTATEQRQR